ncbi:hypothetical protein [Pedobacter sp. SYSU D00535]|uniref:hypothetical protein n=1 Tax=Pedobacter sp. SYSU D00535 TaxID=2810308 RepID=UPI001A95CC6F|nr:hypothetical protein [Pedobacter sp. SYSU D00535]
MNKKIVGLLLISTGLLACNNTEKAADVKSFFDISGFFDAEAKRLSGLNPSITKTVSQNDASEAKTLKIDDWQAELSLFTESDINKPAWKNSYLVKRGLSGVTYLALDKSLRTQKIELRFKEPETIKSIAITNVTNNPLYTSTETLFYSPDSLYLINKEQHVRVLGNNNYRISGKFPPQ